MNDPSVTPQPAPADIDLGGPAEQRPSDGDLLADLLRIGHEAAVADRAASGRPRDVLVSPSFLRHLKREIPAGRMPASAGLGLLGMPLLGLPLYVDRRAAEGTAIVRRFDGRMTILDAREAIAAAEPSPTVTPGATTAAVDPQLRTAALAIIATLAIVAVLGALSIVTTGAGAAWYAVATVVAAVVGIVGTQWLGRRR